MLDGKWRSDLAASEEKSPSSLPDWRNLLGVEQHISGWRSLVRNDALPPVLLLTGRAGIGKRGLLAALAALHFCEQGSACGRCSPCTWLMQGRHPEMLWLEASEGRFLLEDAKRLQEHLELSPGPATRWRLAVIVDADRLSLQAANRLLKTLEEPQPHARVFLSTSRVGAMLPTVLSRCVKWLIPPPPLESLRPWFKARLLEMGEAKLAEAALDDLLGQAGLSPGMALSALANAGADLSLEVSTWLDARSPQDALALVESSVRGSSVNASILIEAAELALNRRYRSCLRQGRKPPFLAMTSRRDILRRARQVARGGQVPVNAQMLGERLALAGREMDGSI